MPDARALVAYYRDCVEAESRTEAMFEARDPSIALLTEGGEPVVSGGRGPSVPVPMSASVWASGQLAAAPAGPVWCGYPLAVARRGGRPVLAPLFSRECQLAWGHTGPVMQALDAGIESNEPALILLGWDRDERSAWLEHLARLPPLTFGHAIHRAARAGMAVAHLDPRRLRPLPYLRSQPSIANTAMLFTPELSRAARGVIAELDQLATGRVSRLRRGPLGIVLGQAALRAPPRRDRPLPIVLPSNLAQDQAIQSAQRSPLTVVTGPPGTGKSQVLVNAVAATVLAGHTVLFASRTNRAVDVVFERLRELDGGAVPVRAGHAELRAQAADVMRHALTTSAERSQRPPAAAQTWPGLSQRIGRLARLAAERRSAFDRWLAALDEADRISASARWDPAIGTAARAAQASAARRLALLPPDEALRVRLAGYEAARVAAGRELWQLAWTGLGGRAARRHRRGAAALAHHLELGRPAGADAAYRLGLPAFPVWGLTNLAAAACLPMSPDLFDLVIIDEASQCDVASALPLLARARRALVIGDPQQLQHVSRLSPARDEAIARRHGIGTDVLAMTSQRQRSLYEVAATRSSRSPLLLDEHYRCHPRVIAFSNERLYSGRLTIRTSPTPGGGLLWRDTAGSFRRGPGGRSACNREEAAAVVDQLEAERRARPGATIGVVAPFRAQVELIRQLASRASSPPAPIARTITIDTVHRFQGDERDVMLLSPAVSADMPYFFRGVAGQPRLLNVAVTRARQRFVVVSDREACLATGGLLAELAAYAVPITEPPITEVPGP